MLFPSTRSLKYLHNTVVSGSSFAVTESLQITTEIDVERKIMEKRVFARDATAPSEYFSRSRKTVIAAKMLNNRRKYRVTIPKTCQSTVYTVSTYKSTIISDNFLLSQLYQTLIQRNGRVIHLSGTKLFVL